MKENRELMKDQNILGRIAALCVDRYKMVFILILSILLSGSYSYFMLPKETVPDISANMLYVMMSYPGASVNDVDVLVSEPIEDALKGMDDVKDISSTVGNGYAQVVVEYEDSANMDDAEQEVRNEVDKISFPDGAMDPVIGVFETGDIPVFNVTLTGNYDLTELKRFGDEIQSQMESVSGIREVDVSGGYEREIQVIVDPVRLSEYGLTFQSISQALQSTNLNLPAGEQTIDGVSVNVRIDERITNIDDVRNIIVKASDSGTIFLYDVAVVRDLHKTPSNYSRVFVNEPDAVQMSTPAIYLTVYREDGYDIVKPAETLRQIIETHGHNSVPSDVEFIVTNDMSVDVVKDLGTVINNALGGLICVIIVLYIFIGLNEALIVATVIPISLLISFIVMRSVGITFNTISLAGFIIALGLLVDNAIVVMENIDKYRDEGMDRTRAAKVGTNQVAMAILAATLTTIGAFAPVAMTGGIMGKFLGIMPKTIIIIIASSLFVSIVVTPALSSKFLTTYKKKHKAHRISDRKRHIISGVFIMGLSLLAFTNQWVITNATIITAIGFTLIYAIKAYASERSRDENHVGMIARYKNWLSTILESRLKKLGIVALSIIVFIGACATIPLGILKMELFPYEEPSSIKIGIEAPIGTPLDDTDAIVYQVEDKLYGIKDIESFTSKVGSNSSNEASVIVELVDKEDRILSGNEIQSQIRNLVSNIPGAKFEISQQGAMGRVSGGSAVSLGLKGENLEELTRYANLYYDQLVQVPGVVEAKLSTDNGKKEIYIDIDENRASHYGLTVTQIASELRRYISGVTVGTYLEDSEEYDISVYYSDDFILSVKDFDKIFFVSNSGESIAFSEVADIKEQTGLGTIEKDNGDIIIYVESDVLDGYNSVEVNRAFQMAVKDIQLPSGITPAVGGEMADLNEQVHNMLVNFGVALLIVYLILVLQFNSLIQPMIILISIPFAIIGVVFGLVVTGNNLGFYAMFGVVALAGIAVNDAIVLIDHTNFLRGEGISLKTAVPEAVKDRFQPVLATSLTTIGGVLPLALYNDTFSQLGFALIFGLFASTILTLLIIPMLYYSIEKRFEKHTRGEQNEK